MMAGSLFFFFFHEEKKKKKAPRDIGRCSVVALALGDGLYLKKIDGKIPQGGQTMLCDRVGASRDFRDFLRCMRTKKEKEKSDRDFITFMQWTREAGALVPSPPLFPFFLPAIGGKRMGNGRF